MARKNLFMGPRLKRIRRDLGLTQANMAADLDISPSYVALMERNQRPVTADLLLKLAATYKMDIASLADDGGDEQARRLQAAMGDPIFADIDLPRLDLADIATSFPGMAEAFLRLHTAFAEEQLTLAQRRETMAGMEAGLPGHRSGDEAGIVHGDPVAEVRAFLAARRNCFPALEDHAETIARAMAEGGGPKGSGALPGPTMGALVDWLHRKSGRSVRFVDPAVIMGSLRWHDSHREQIMVSELLDHAGRRFQLALQVALFEAEPVIDREVSSGRFSTDNSRRLARRALANYWAAALVMPYRAMRRAARELRHDLEALARRFGCSFEQVAHRLTTLGRSGEEGVPFFFIRVDRAGNVSKRLDGAGFPFARFGGACPLWTLHGAFETPGEVLAQRLVLPDGEQFLSVVRTVTAGGGSRKAPAVTRAIALGCAQDHASALVYADELASVDPTPIGIACELCHRPACVARSAPPIGRELRPDDYRVPPTPFAFSDDWG